MANPEGKEYDKDDLRELAFIVYYKVLLYYLTDEVSYYDDIRKNIYEFLSHKGNKNFQTEKQNDQIKCRIQFAAFCNLTFISGIF